VNADERIAAAVPNHRARLAGLARSMETPEVSADDLAQEGYIAMWRACDKWKQGTNFAGYLMTAARNRMIAVASGSNRQLGNESRVPQQKRTTSIDKLRDEYGWDMAARDAMDDVELAYHHGQINRALDALPDKVRAAVVQKFWHDRRDHDIYKALRVRKDFWTFARAELRESLADLESLVTAA
jgi:RNA polymerase sigma factor (sigma-70 family)